MIVVDSSVWIAFLRGQETSEIVRLHEFADKDEILIGDIVLFEVLRGARDERHAARLEQDMRAFPIVPFLDDELAVAAAQHSRRLRTRGYTVAKAPDLIIATYCIKRGHSLLHADRDFAPMRDHLGLIFA